MWSFFLFSCNCYEIQKDNEYTFLALHIHSVCFLPVTQFDGPSA